MLNRIPESIPNKKVSASSTAPGILIVNQSIWVSTVAVFCTITMTAIMLAIIPPMCFAFFMFKLPVTIIVALVLAI